MSEFRQTEIENLYRSALGQKNVRRLDVAMNDALRVRGIETRRRSESLFPAASSTGERLTRDAMLQRLALQQLHRDEGAAFVFANFVNRADIWMIQRRGRTRLALEAFDRLRSWDMSSGRNFSAT